VTRKNTAIAEKIKLVIQLTGGMVLVCAGWWYLATQFATIDSQLDRVMSADMPTIKKGLDADSKTVEKLQVDMGILTKNIEALEKQKERIRKMQASIELLSQKFDDELPTEEMEREQTTDAVKMLVAHIDRLSKQYRRFLERAENKIVVSLPPKWVDELPTKRGTLYALGIGPGDVTFKSAQKQAVEQALSMMSVTLRKKTFDEVRSIVTSAGKPSPLDFEELTPAFKKQVNKAVNELLGETHSESYWVDPDGYVYALVSLPIEKYLEGSELGALIETLRQTKQSITTASTKSRTSLKSDEDLRKGRKETKITDPYPALAMRDKMEDGKKSETQPVGDYTRGDKEDAIKKFLLGWINEWENKDLENHMERYSKECTFGKMNWTQLRKYKKELYERYHRIAVTFNDIEITPKGTRALVSYKQYYRADGYSDYGLKSLILKKEKGEWKIFKEEWEPLPND
jgi:hypothetical protein